MADNQNQGNQGGSERGFAAMDDEKQREIAKKGGEASHKNDKNRGGGSQNEGGSSGSNR